jgi:hypothetical protein
VKSKENITGLVTDIVSYAFNIHPSPFRFPCAGILRKMGPLCIFQDQNVTKHAFHRLPQGGQGPRAHIFIAA